MSRKPAIDVATKTNIEKALTVLENNNNWLYSKVRRWERAKETHSATRQDAKWVRKYITRMQYALALLDRIVCVELEETPEILYEISEEMEMELGAKSENDS